jgi:hypothetical protein
MGLAWVADDAGHAFLSESGPEWTAGPRHRRPTLLARSGQAVACRITALARPDAAAAAAGPDAGHQDASRGDAGDRAAGRTVGGHLVRRASLPARRYWP